MKIEGDFIKTFSNWKDLEKYLTSIINAEIQKVGEEVRKALKQELKAKFYGRAGYHQNQESTDWYDRTWQLVECITLSPTNINGNEYSVRIFYDTDKMTTFSTEGKWSTHESIIDGRDFRKALPEVIEYGNPSTIYGWEGFDIVGDLTDRLIDDKVVLQWFVKALEKKGFKCIV